MLATHPVGNDVAVRTRDPGEELERVAETWPIDQLGNQRQLRSGRVGQSDGHDATRVHSSGSSVQGAGDWDRDWGLGTGDWRLVDRCERVHLIHHSAAASV